MKFELKFNEAEEYYWRFLSGNGEVIAWSEGYADKRDALHAIELVKTHAKDAEIVDRSRLREEY
jgi:uncharacterized protein YegP (UPF0339 family)